MTRSDNGETAAKLESSSPKQRGPGERVARTIERVHTEIKAGRTSLRAGLQTVSLAAIRAGRDLEIYEQQRLRVVP